MRKPVVLGLLVLSAVAVAGCSFDSHAAVVKSALAEMNQMQHSLAKITRADTLEQYKGEVDQAFTNLQYIKARRDALPALSETERDRLRMKYAEPMSAMYNKVASELNRVGSYGKADEFAKMNKFIKENFADDFRVKK